MLIALINSERKNHFFASTVYNRVQMSIIIIDNAKDLLPSEKTPTHRLCETLRKLKIPYHMITSADEMNRCPKPLGFILTSTTVYTPPNEVQKKVTLNASTMTIYPNVPVLGICWGFQILAECHGASIQPLHSRNEGDKTTTFVGKNPLLNNIDTLRFQCRYSHNNYVETLPKHWNALGFVWVDHQMITVAACHSKLPRYGLLFHPEYNKEGDIILKNFYEVCKKRNKSIGILHKMWIRIKHRVRRSSTD